MPTGFVGISCQCRLEDKLLLIFLCKLHIIACYWFTFFPNTVSQLGLLGIRVICSTWLSIIKNEAIVSETGNFGAMVLFLLGVEKL